MNKRTEESIMKDAHSDKSSEVQQQVEPISLFLSLICVFGLGVWCLGDWPKELFPLVPHYIFVTIGIVSWLGCIFMVVTAYKSTQN